MPPDDPDPNPDHPGRGRGPRADETDTDVETFADRAHDLLDTFISLFTSRTRTDEDVIDLIDEHAADPDADAGADVEQAVDPAEAQALLDESRTTLTKLQLMLGTQGETWTAGPERISVDPGHDTPLWGMRFETERHIYLGDCTLAAASGGTITVRAYRFDDDAYEIEGVEDEVELELEGGEQDVHLGLHLSPGYYLLTRPVPSTPDEAPADFDGQPDSAFQASDDLLSLAREDYEISEADNKHGVRFDGIRNPAWTGPSEGRWYYFYDLSITAPDGEDA